MSKTELCRACKIFQICHEPNKYFAKFCQHFKGDMPNGYIKYQNNVVQLIYKRGFGANIAYLNMPHGKVWLDQSKLTSLMLTCLMVKER